VMQRAKAKGWERCREQKQREGLLVKIQRRRELRDVEQRQREGLLVLCLGMLL
jgi:hypothetical protein